MKLGKGTDSVANSLLNLHLRRRLRSEVAHSRVSQHHHLDVPEDATRIKRTPLKGERLEFLNCQNINVFFIPGSTGSLHKSRSALNLDSEMVDSVYESSQIGT